MKPASLKIYLFLIPIVCGVFSSCNVCKNVARVKATSGDGKLIATIYERNCGATTDFTSIVNIRSVSESGDGEDKNNVFIVKGRSAISAVWDGPRKLTISCESCSRVNIFRQVVAIGDIDIYYKLIPDNH